MSVDELEILVVRFQKKRKNRDFKAIYDILCQSIYYVCLRYLKNEVEAQEVLQQTFIRVFEKIDSYNHKGSFEGWVKRIAVNFSLTKIKQNQKIVFEEQIDDYALIDEEEIEPDSLTKDILLKKLKELPDGYRTIISLYVLEEYSHKEIAEMLSISESTSKSQLLRAKKKLVEMFKVY